MAQATKLLIVTVLLVSAFLSVGADATRSYVPQNVHDGQCYTVNGHIPAPSSFCGVRVVEADVEQVWSGRSAPKAAASSTSANDVILGSEEEAPEQTTNDPKTAKARAAKAAILDLPNGDHLWAATEYVWNRFDLLLAYDCELDSAFVSSSQIEDVVDRMRVATGGAIELLPRNVSLGEDYVAVGVDDSSNVMLAVDAGSWRSSLVMFACGRG